MPPAGELRWPVLQGGPVAITAAGGLAWAHDGYRMHLAGWPVYYVHTAEVVHYCGETRKREANRSALEAEMAALKSSGAQAPGDDGFWVPERHGQRRVPLEAIDWVPRLRRLFVHRERLCTCLGLIEDRQQVVGVRVGGSFGGRVERHHVRSRDDFAVRNVGEEDRRVRRHESAA